MSVGSVKEILIESKSDSCEPLFCLFTLFPVHCVEFLPFLKSRNDDDRSRNVPATIFPFMFQMRRKEQAVTRLQVVDLTLHLIFQFAPQTKDELMPRV